MWLRERFGVAGRMVRHRRARPCVVDLYIADQLLFPGQLGGIQNAATTIGDPLRDRAAARVRALLRVADRSADSPSQILMHPLGGLAFADRPHRPWPTFVTVRRGPLVNVMICVITAVWLAVMAGTWRIVPWRPLDIDSSAILVWHSQTAISSGGFFCVSYALLLFNLLPIFPLDGGQMLQSILWMKFGYYRATNFATITGMIGASMSVGLGP